jgi:hypothetical protein
MTRLTVMEVPLLSAATALRAGGPTRDNPSDERRPAWRMPHPADAMTDSGPMSNGT